MKTFKWYWGAAQVSASLIDDITENIYKILGSEYNNTIEFNFKDSVMFEDMKDLLQSCYKEVNDNEFIDQLDNRFIITY